MNKTINKEYKRYGLPFLLGRVNTVFKTHYGIEVEGRVYNCKVSGRFNYIAYQKSDYPVVGDYVVFKPSDYDDTGVIEKVCTRYSTVQRMDVGNIVEEQILASNVDVIFVCMSLNEDFRLIKLQNFLSLTYSSSADVVILLTKSDLCEDIEFFKNEVRKIDDTSKIMVVSIEDQTSIELLGDVLVDKTGVFIGSSGVGKSTIVNKLLGYDYLDTKDIRGTDDQGRHTTSHRELVHLKNGGSIIDTPGIRIVYSYILDDVGDAFKKVSELAMLCRFNDCTHSDEPGCNVVERLDSGDLPIEVYDSYIKTVKLNRFNKKREMIRQKMQDKRKRG